MISIASDLRLDDATRRKICDLTADIISRLSLPTNPTIFLKPNWVAGVYRRSCQRQDSIWSTITHPIVIAGVVDGIDKVFGTAAKVVVGDNPSIDADFDDILRVSEIDKLLSGCRSEISVLDLRPLVCPSLDVYGKRELMLPQHGDPLGGCEIDLSVDSMLEGLDSNLFRGVFDDNSETVLSHSSGRHLYSLSGSIVAADLFISVPKLKTHHKVGVTLNLKGLVGAAYSKDLLVHWRNGYPEIGGDEYPNEATWRADQKSSIKSRGAWDGNDTIWRMVVDLFLALRRLSPGRPNITLIDGIISGEGEGPFCPTARDTGVVIAGDNLLGADLVATRLMGFNPLNVKYLRHFLDRSHTDEDVESEELHKYLELAVPIYQHVPPRRWGSLLT